MRTADQSQTAHDSSDAAPPCTARKACLLWITLIYDPVYLTDCKRLREPGVLHRSGPLTWLHIMALCATNRDTVTPATRTLAGLRQLQARRQRDALKQETLVGDADDVAGAQRRWAHGG